MANSPNTILFLLASNGQQIGGMEQQLSLQVKALSKLNHYHLVVAAHPAYADLFPDTHCQFYEIHSEKSRHHPRLLLQISKLIAKVAPDLLHVHGTKAASLAINSLRWPTSMGWMKHSKPKLCATVHGTKKSLKVYKHFDLLFAVSPSISKNLKPLFSTILWNAIPRYSGHKLSKKQVCEEYEFSDKRPLLISVGRLAPVKRYDQLMSACEHLPVNLLILGDGPEKAKLERHCSDTIKLGGYKTAPQAYVSGADALIISSDREGLSLSMLEALQMDVPVLSTPVSGSRDLLPKSCILDNSSEDSFGRSLSGKVMQLKEIHDALTQVYERTRNDFSPESVVSTLASGYDDLLAD